MLPAFFPDATYGNVKCADSADLGACGVRGMVCNTFHLMSKPGLGVLRKHGGIHAFNGYKGAVLTDSGGFQAFSLIKQNPAYGQIRSDCIIFRPDMGSDKLILSPSKCIQAQFAIRSDIIMCLDHCTHPSEPYDVQKKAVDSTIKWARLCKEEYQLQLKNYKYGEIRPLLFAIIQGGNDYSLRKYCAEELVAIGFDGFGFGGWPLSEGGEFLYELLEYTASLMPNGSVKYAMGVGKPEEIRACMQMGYNLFDCVIPTREARHGRLYVAHGDTYKYIYTMDTKNAAVTSPPDPSCNCPLCRNYSLGYLHHLAKNGDTLANRLATLHNLTFYQSCTKS